MTVLILSLLVLCAFCVSQNMFGDTGESNKLAKIISNSNSKSISTMNQVKPKKVSHTPSENTQMVPVDIYSVEGQDSSRFLLKLDKNYTPYQIAEYIYSTGDEKGITQVISEMIQDGQIMASRDDVLGFLEDVQKELRKLRRTA